VSRNGVAKIIESFRGLGTGPMTADATLEQGFESIVGTLKGGKVEGGSIGDGAKFLQDRELATALGRREQLVGDWQAMKTDFAREGGVLDQLVAKYKGRPDSPITFDAAGHPEIPFWNKALKYPADNRNPLLFPEAKAALDAMSPTERAALDIHRTLQAEIGKWMRS
jgi:hypothetical protein